MNANIKNINMEGKPSFCEYLARFAFALWLCAVIYECTPTDIPLIKILTLALLFIGLTKRDKTLLNARL